MIEVIEGIFSSAVSLKFDKADLEEP